MTTTTSRGERAQTYTDRIVKARRATALRTLKELVRTAQTDIANLETGALRPTNFIEPYATQWHALHAQLLVLAEVQSALAAALDGADA